jgi:hypothetical protein
VNSALLVANMDDQCRLYSRLMYLKKIQADTVDLSEYDSEGVVVGSKGDNHNAEIIPSTSNNSDPS